MDQSQKLVVIDSDGQRGIIQAFHPKEKRYVIEYNDQTFLLPADLLVSLSEHYYTLPISFAEVFGDQDVEVAKRLVIPVLEEELQLAKRIVEKDKIRVHKAIIEREEIVDEPLVEDRVEIERVPINRLLKKPVEARTEGDTTIIPILKEVLVVEKHLMLVEEVRLTRKQVEVRRPQTVILRREEVHIERIPAGAEIEDVDLADSNNAAIYAKGE